MAKLSGSVCTAWEDTGLGVAGAECPDDFGGHWHGGRSEATNIRFLNLYNLLMEQESVVISVSLMQVSPITKH